jgi:acyl carrier protein
MMKEKIHSYIFEDILNEEVDITDDTPLYSSAIITSMGHLKLVNYLERTFDVSIPMSEVTLEKFDSINLITKFIQSRSEKH